MGGGDILVKQAQGRGARCAREVELGELAFGEGGEGPLPPPSPKGRELAGIATGFDFSILNY